MAALSESPALRIVDLRELRAEDLAPVLDEEVESWRRELDWDFRPSAELVRRYVQMQALNGYCLLAGGRAAGYVYYVCEERKGLIGDLYVVDQCRSAENENLLLGAVLDPLLTLPIVRRVESQLMMISAPFSRPLPHRRFLHSFPRCFMEMDLQQAGSLPSRSLPDIRLDLWNERRQESAGRLIAVAYQGHVDSRINDQYRSPGGASRFLLNIIQYPGCGTFFQPASWVAIEAATGQLCGISLASLVSSDVGHITQICVIPAVKGKGVGYELLRRSLVSLAEHGCRKVSLTVTASNLEAIRLYQNVGFFTRRNFAAMVWEAPG